jgi:hypothetical protein
VSAAPPVHRVPGSRIGLRCFREKEEGLVSPFGYDRDTPKLPEGCAREESCTLMRPKPQSSSPLQFSSSNVWATLGSLMAAISVSTSSARIGAPCTELNANITQNTILRSLRSKIHLQEELSS